MTIKQKKRSEISDDYKWDLSSIYKSDESFELDLKNVTKEIEEIVKYKGKILENANTLYAFLNLYFDLNRKLEKLFMYAHLNNDSDTTDNHYQVLYGKVSNLYQKFGELTTFVVPEFLKSDYSLVLNYMNEKTEIKEYENYLKEVYRYQPHTLSETEEKIFSTLSKVFSLPSKTYSKLTDTDLKLGTIEVDGVKIELTDHNYSKYISSKDRHVRKQAFETMYKGYEGVINTLASTMAGEVEINEKIAKLKNYEDAMEMALFEDNVNKNIYDNLIDTVSKHLNILFKYYNLRKDVLKLDKLNLYDLYVDLIADSEKEYSFEEGKKLVLEALGVLGEDYIANLNKAFDEKWIDIYSNVGKRSGAYSSGCYDTNPYVLLNYQDELEDVSTLAHELGHSMHSYYSRKANSYQDSDYKIFVAEVASTVNELLLFKHMLSVSKDNHEKLSILNRLMELFKGTIYRQTMFAEFEKKLYEQNSKGEILTAEYISNMYYDLNKKYFGESVNLNEEIKYEWARIPHFYYFFYVYKYATGLSAACYIVENILSGKENAKENYLEFLKTGGKYFPLDELKIAGVDMTDPAVIESALKMFNDIIDKFIEVYSMIDKENKDTCKIKAKVDKSIK